MRENLQDPELGRSSMSFRKTEEASVTGQEPWQEKTRAVGSRGALPSQEKNLDIIVSDLGATEGGF